MGGHRESTCPNLNKNNSQYSDTKHKWRTHFGLSALVFFCLAGNVPAQEILETTTDFVDPFVATRPTVTELHGGQITDGQIIWRLNKSPYLLREDLVVEKDGELIVEKGVEVRFGPMVGITVRGRLTAEGTESNKIIFTSIEEPTAPPKAVPDVRLVDGPSILAGRVQILHKGHWRSVCTNSRNWTRSDMETACRQLGFQGGNFYNWFNRIEGRHPRILYEEPKCSGTELDLFQCDWKSKQLGSGMCDYHPDLGIQCLPRHENDERAQPARHWRGLRFEAARHERLLTSYNTLYVPTSMSTLKHIVIKNAGVGRENNATSALQSLGVPPKMENIEISKSIYNAINITLPNAPVFINNCTIRNNRGYGIYINSTYGMAQIENCLITENGGDGIKHVVHEINPDDKHDRSDIFDFCTLPTTASQTFPIQMSVEQSKYSNAERDCTKYFYTREGHILTLSFVKLLTNRNDTGFISVYDGNSMNDKQLASFSLRNNTRPQSITSTKNKIFIRFHAQTRTEILGFLRLSSGLSKSYDLKVTDSVITDNNGRGIAIENLRSQIHIHRTSISNNNHVSGLQIVSGVGDINVTESRISFNQGDGINITTTGGNRNISRSTLSSNSGYGLAIWINNTKETEYVHFNQSTVVQYSEIFKNLEVGVLHGNYCRNSWINITGNWFNNSIDNAIDISSCWEYNENEEKMILQIGHNKFVQTLKTAIRIQPALNIDGRIEYNHFEQGSLGAILLRNQIQNRLYEEFEILPATFLIQYNQFYTNKGQFVVNLGLSPYSDLQYVMFTRNFLRENRVREPFENIDTVSSKLIPRSRVSAVIVLSSSNVDIYRNIIHNPESTYEIGSQLEDQSKILNCTFNWLGFSEEDKIFNRLFHRKDRYNLAKIIYLPYLLHNSNPGATQINYNPMYVPQFNVPGTNTVGGEVDGIELLKTGEYNVVRDINIRPGGKLILQSGVTLKFPPSIGMMVAGKLDARGRSPNDITLTLKQEIVMTNDNDTYEVEAEQQEGETEIVEIEPVVPIRLLGGRTSNEGRLQLRIDGRWGTVCNYHWTILNAGLVCNQLGLVLNPDDWYLERNKIPNAGLSEDIILSNVDCTEFDTDITLCKAETVEQFENSCTHDMDVGLKCYDTSWAGVRFGVLSERADLQFVNIEKAGLLDYATNMFKPALQIDFARHGFESIRISNNFQDGLGIIYSDLYGADAINTVRNSEFSNNKGSGISFKQLGLKVHGSVIENNYIGISHNPHLTAFQQRELAGWFVMAPDVNTDESNYNPIMLPEYQTDISLENGETRYIVTTKYYGANIQKTYNIKCNPGYVIGIQLLNPIHNFSSEALCIYDSQNINEKSTKWCLDRDLSVFPTTSSSFGIVLTYESGKAALGSTVLVVSTLLAPVQDIRNRIVKGPVPTLTVVSTKIKGNTRGIQASYYNRYLNELGDHFLRKANETLKILNCEISHNIEEAIFINTPFWDIHESNITEITIMINNSLITDNGRGIFHFARDLRSSNNLYHYILQDNSIERNRGGGFEINLPYVWQYNENFTHSVYLNNNTWRSNNLFGFVVDGHFASVNISRNIFTDNICQNGLISIKGMEKRMKIDYNKIERNNGKFMVEFRTDSQSEILGEVVAVFLYNEIKHNKYLNSLSRGFQMHAEPASVVSFGGIQKVQINRNLFGQNVLTYDLVAGIRTAKINNLLEVTENWWGSNSESDIRKRIFDFDDWNNHAIANFHPYLIEDSFDSSISVSFSEINEIDLDNLGGRLTEDLAIHRRGTPYIIKSDITVMPGATLTITPGVRMEFAPDVGILVLGTLIAQGVKGYEIEMAPLSVAGNIDNNRIERDVRRREKRQLEQMVVQESIRLCSGFGNCSSVNDFGEKVNEGFWEYYNRTTFQWIPMCDTRFTERNAQVVCRELGFDPINVYFDYDRRIEYHSGSLARIWSWPEPLQCKGTESHYEDCPIRLNGQLYGHRHECKWDSMFIFIHCGKRNLDPQQEYWGGIRFANPEFEYTLYEHRIHDIHTHETVQRKESILEFVKIEGAGMLHNEKSPAIQSIVKSPRINFVNITKSAHHGINLISPSETMNLMFNQIHDSLGIGINSISLTGEGRESDESSFSPLKELNLPYHMFSMVDICDTSKVITIEEKVLLYYKYDNNPVNCVKIFNSVYRVKPFGFRLLQFNLFNHTKTYGNRDSITLYDGDIYNVTAPVMGYLESGSLEEKKLFRSRGPSMSIKLFANGASAVHGFIAEVVTLPISAIGFNRDVQHNISYSGFSKNRQGAFTYQSVGEVNPIVTMERNEIINNCQKLYGNFTTCRSAIEIDVQNTQTFYFRNNLVQGNEGGLAVRADSRGSATSLKGWIHNNLFYDNHDLPCLKIEGRQSSPYQEVTIYRNYFTRNKTPFKDVIVLRQIVSNFTMNYVHSNRGMRILEVSGFDKVRLPIYQTTSHNGFYGNYALDREGRATVVAGTAGQHYVDNIFFNPDNDYEMITVNRSIQLELWRTRIDAAHNYWSVNETSAVSGRIRDRSDNPLLLEVEYRPFYMNNASVLNGKCPPGWDIVGDTCYMYVGAPMTYRDAREFCLSDNASMPYISGNYLGLWQFLRKQDQWYQYSDKVWVQHIDYVTQCTAFAYQTIEINNCEQKNAFLCEIDPKVHIDPLSWKDDVVTVAVIGVLAAAVLFVGIVIACWYSKSKHRQVQRLERRNSIRQSLHSVRSMASMNGGFADINYRRKVGQMSARSTDTLTKTSDYKKMLVSSPSMDSVEKSQFNSSVEDNQSYDIYEAHNPNPNLMPMQHTTFQKKESPKYSTPMHNLNNAFDLAYKNEGFRDNSTLPSAAPSINTVLTEETPIIHHQEGYPSTSHSTYADDDLNHSPQSDLNYFNSDTLPLRGNFKQSSDTIDLKKELDRDNRYGQYGAPAYGAQPKLSFLKELRHKLPDHPPSGAAVPPTTFGQRRNNIAGNIYYEDNLPSPPHPPVYERPPHYEAPPSMHPEGRAYDSPKGIAKSRSKSEALLETSFDDDAEEAQLTEANRSHSQPLETAM